MTAQLETDMDGIAEGQQSLEGVVDRSREVLSGILEIMEEQKEEIAREIRDGIKGDTVLGACPRCGGEIQIRRARKSGKRFAGCGSYPDCEQLYPLPQKGGIVGSGEICEECGSPKIKVLVARRRPWELCLDPECPTKKDRADGEKDVPSAQGEAAAR